MLVNAAKNLEWLDLKAFSNKPLEEDPLLAEEVAEGLKDADLLFFYRSTEDFWTRVEKTLREAGAQAPPIVCVGHDPSLWTLSTVKAETVATAHSYMTYGGEENITNLLRYIAREALGEDIACEPPKPVPWEGIYHPDAPASHFEKLEDYFSWRPPKDGQGTVGVLFSRFYWASKAVAVEDQVIRELEGQGLNVIPVFSYSMRDDNLGTRSSGEVVEDVFFNADGSSRIDAMVKMQPFFLGGRRQDDLTDGKKAKTGVEIMKRLDVPVFQPITAYHKSIETWEADPQGLGSDIAWSVALPEFEGVIEPLLIGAGKRTEDGDADAGVELRAPIEERCRRLARRVKKWVDLQRKPVTERKVAFILHNNPCVSVEASVGGAANLDSLESVARVMHAMKESGYSVEPPADGKELIETIMGRKAISEFRWTTVDEIVNKGGALARVSLDEYREWWETFPEKVRDRIAGAWGNPPGEEMNGMPPAMVYEGTILVTGVQYGNAVVCAQPKRGCAGARCDGQVCKILHDPDVPPPHQYLATYRHLENTFGADVLVHVGTHGNLEFLPGKGVGLSEACLPDLSIHEIPHLYIYNSDNPPEGTIAKRRSCATLVDHMQTVMVQGGLYEGLEELERGLAEYEQARITDKARAHALEHEIMDAILRVNLDKEIKLKEGMPFAEVAKAAHEALSRIRNTQIQDGMHIFGELPEGEKRVAFINSILRYDAGEERSLRKDIAKALGLNLQELMKDQGAVHPVHLKSHGQLLEEIDSLCREAIGRLLASRGNGGERKDTPVFADAPYLEDLPLDSVRAIGGRIMDLDRRIDESREIDALLRGFEGGYIAAGPSGLITRGRDDILPTGRNFFSLDPQRVPTKAAVKVGEKLAQAVIEKHRKEEGKFPENVAIYWMCSDIMWSDGEGMAQILSLLGARPLWLSNGRVKGFEIIPLEELGRPRVDVTIRVSGITRDNFPNCVELVDEVVQAVAVLDEPSEMNFVRKHTLEQIAADKADASDKQLWRKATYRIFASKPGTYMAGVNLAVYASAWKDEADLADVFVYWNGYAYGKGVFGEESQKQLIHSLKTVDATFNKVVTDEYDLFGCCCYFGTHGGMTAAARSISGREVRTYYGDTREPENVEVRDLADEVRRVVRTKLLNPRWIEGMKRHGYKGAGDISKRIGRVYGWESTTREVDDWIFDDIARTFVLDEENRKFFQENNPWALEEIGRRLLEAFERGLWKADEQVIEELKERYLEVESWIEDHMGEVTGEFQGGAIDVMTSEDVENWGVMMQEVKEKLKAARS
jgi:cobaltochelatase CobN